MKFNLIGAGRLGKNIGLALSANGLASLQSICNRSIVSANTACQLIGSGSPVQQIECLTPAEITWITCNDDSIQEVVAKLLQSSTIRSNEIIVHCSGALNSSILSPLKAAGCSIASFHPLKAFKEGYLSMSAFDQVDCILEGDPLACQQLTALFNPLNANVMTIQTERKAAYHAGACIASNYLITLASLAQELFLHAMIPSHQTKEMICRLMLGNINNMENAKTIGQALTGPLARGDVETISLHLQSIENPDILKLYKLTGLATLDLTELSIDKKNKIVELLSQ